MSARRWPWDFADSRDPRTVWFLVRQGTRQDGTRQRVFTADTLPADANTASGQRAYEGAAVYECRENDR